MAYLYHRSNPKGTANMSLGQSLDSVTGRLERLVIRVERISDQLRLCTRILTSTAAGSGEVLTRNNSTVLECEFDSDFIDAKFSEWIDSLKRKARISGQNLPPDEVWIGRIERNARRLFGADWKYELVKRILDRKTE